MLSLAASVGSSNIGLFAGVIALGFLIGAFGHVIHSRTLILTGILVIGLVSGYYALVLEPAK